jgi:hypothetical protein
MSAGAPRGERRLSGDDSDGGNDDSGMVPMSNDELMAFDHGAGGAGGSTGASAHSHLRHRRGGHERGGADSLPSGLPDSYRGVLLANGSYQGDFAHHHYDGDDEERAAAGYDEEEGMGAGGDGIDGSCGAVSTGGWLLERALRRERWGLPQTPAPCAVEMDSGGTVRAPEGFYRESTPDGAFLRDLLEVPSTLSSGRADTAPDGPWGSARVLPPSRCYAVSCRVRPTSSSPACRAYSSGWPLMPARRPTGRCAWASSPLPTPCSRWRRPRAQASNRRHARRRPPATSPSCSAFPPTMR